MAKAILNDVNKELGAKGLPTVSEEIFHWRMQQIMPALIKPYKRAHQGQPQQALPDCDTGSGTSGSMGGCTREEPDKGTVEGLTGSGTGPLPHIHEWYGDHDRGSSR